MFWSIIILLQVKEEDFFFKIAISVYYNLGHVLRN